MGPAQRAGAIGEDLVSICAAHGDGFRNHSFILIRSCTCSMLLESTTLADVVETVVGHLLPLQPDLTVRSLGERPFPTLGIQSSASDKFCSDVVQKMRHINLICATWRLNRSNDVNYAIHMSVTPEIHSENSVACSMSCRKTRETGATNRRPTFVFRNAEARFGICAGPSRYLSPKGDQ